MLKALVLVAVVLACFANIEAASITSSASASWSVSVTGTVSVSGTVSPSWSQSVSNTVTGSVSQSVAATITSSATVSSLQNTCGGKPLIICLSWSSTNAVSFTVTIGSQKFVYNKPAMRNVDLVDLDPSTTYTITLTATDSNGRASAAQTLTVTTGSDNAKSDPKGRGPSSLSCSQVGTSAAIKATWSLQANVPDFVIVSVNCPGYHGRKKTVKGSLTTATIPGIFGDGADAKTVSNCVCKLRAKYKINPNGAVKIEPIKTKFALTIPA